MVTVLIIVELARGHRWSRNLDVNVCPGRDLNPNTLNWQSGMLNTGPLHTLQGAVHKGRPQRRGRGVWSNADTCGQGGGGGEDLADVCKLVLSLLFQHALWMMPSKVQIVMHLTQFAPQSIIWAGTKAYIQLTLRVMLLIT